MNDSERQKYLQIITQRLIIFTMAVLVLVAIGIYVFLHLYSGSSHSGLVTLAFTAGLLGGFVSIQQRLPRIGLSELKILADSWISITLIPINGGIFALVLMLMFVGKIIQGQLFPIYPGDIAITDSASFYNWISGAYPVTGTEVAKLLFWSFAAGFSERLVPQIIHKNTEETIRSDSRNYTNRTNQASDAPPSYDPKQ